MNIIDGLQKKTFIKLERLVTTIGWLVMLGYVTQILFSIVIWLFNLSNFYNKLFTPSNINTTIRTFAITIAIAGGGFIVAYLWGKYNYKRYAHLRRRKFPKDVTNNEIELYFNLQSSLVEKMQNDKIIILEKTIV